MSRLTPYSFDYCPDDVPAAPVERDPDELPAPRYEHRPITREQLLRGINNELTPIDCGAMSAPKETLT